MLFTEITHEVTDNLIRKTVESSIDGLYTPEGHFLTENKELDAENEVLGFDVGQQWDLGPASDDDEGITFRKTPITEVHVLAEYLARKYQGSEESIDWKECPPVWKSFDAWSETIMDEKLDSELNWEYKDLEMILDLIRLRCDNTHRIVNRLLPKVASRRHNENHSALLIQLLFHIYQFRKEPQFKHAKAMFESIINHSDGKLNFSPDRLEPTEEAWLVQTPRHDMICGPFVRLITEWHAIGAFVEASRVLEETFSLFVAEKAKWILVKDPFGFIFCLITPLIRLSTDGLWRTIPALLEVLELLVRKVILLDLHRQSQAVGGLVFRERGCGFCEDCAELNGFLTSPQDTIWEFNAPKTRGLHIEYAIGVEESLQALRVLDQTTGMCEKLRVTKTAAQAQPDLRSLVFNRSGLEKVLQPLWGDLMRKALGEQRYREIILLEGVTPYGPPLNSAEVRRPPTEDGSQPGKRLCTSEMGTIDQGLLHNQTAGQTEAGNV
ncbi:hypothetical protein ACKAV7_006000 [Fusarium commune]